MKFRFGELFCGPGGLALGAIKARVPFANELFSIEHIWASDYDKNSCDTYRNNICPDNPDSVICEDVKKLSINRLPAIDAFAFGFPCNDFSIVGEQKGINGEYGPLYSYGVKVLRNFRPKWFFAENVSGLRNSNEGDTFKIILKHLQEENYTLTPHLYKFEEYGVPQTRHRIIIVGIQKSLGLKFKVPAPNYKYLSCKEAIEKPRIPKDALNQELTKQSKLVVERLKHIKPGENAWTANLPNHLKLNVKTAKLSQIYKRFDPSKPAYTITGSGGGGTHGYHWSENRALTNRERARLQTFPDNFVFLGSKESVRKQIGMAVPPLGAKIIFKSILKTFAKMDYEFVESNIRIEQGEIF